VTESLPTTRGSTAPARDPIDSLSVCERCRPAGRYVDDGRSVWLAEDAVVAGWTGGNTNAAAPTATGDVEVHDTFPGDRDLARGVGRSRVACIHDAHDYVMGSLMLLRVTLPPRRRVPVAIGTAIVAARAVQSGCEGVRSGAGQTGVKQVREVRMRDRGLCRDAFCLLVEGWDTSPWQRGDVLCRRSGRQIRLYC